MNAAHISAVILDLDGTLLNTEQVTKDVLKTFLERYGKVVDIEKENKRLGMMHKETAIAVVKDYDLPITPDQFSQEIMPMYKEKWLEAAPLPGVNRLIKHLHKHGVPFAVASNSRHENVQVKLSSQQGWKEYFSVVLGSDQVKSGKPSPDLFLEAANRMGVDAGCCLVIEDSVIGVKAGKAAKMKVVAVPSLRSEDDQYSIADSVIFSLLEFHPEQWGLPPFDDWVGSALPIEPIQFKGLFKNGILHEISGNGASDLPVQVSGLYFGWAKAEPNKTSKILISAKWERSCCSLKRHIQACLIGEQMCDQAVEVVLVGFIRGFCSKGSTSIDAQILEEDKSIAAVSLDLQAFAYKPSFRELAFKDHSVFSNENE